MASKDLSKLWTPRSGWGLANKGDTRFAAERRLWRFQMTEMRRNLQHQELLARREKYVAARAKKQELEVELARNKPSPMAELRKLEMQDRLERLREAGLQEKLERREAAMQKQAVKMEAENKERIAWLQELQRDYDVEGNAPRHFSMDGRKRRVFLTPENIERQLTAMLMSHGLSPIDKWSDRARETQREEELQQKDAHLGGRAADAQASSGAPRTAAGGRGTSWSTVQSEVTPAELKADIEAGVAPPTDTTSPEFQDKLRSALTNFSQPRVPPSAPQPSEPQPKESDPASPAGPGSNAGKE